MSLKISILTEEDQEESEVFLEMLFSNLYKNV